VQVKDAIHGIDQDEVIRAMNVTVQKKPEDAATFFCNAIRKKARLQVVDSSDSLPKLSTPDPDDPFAY
jgi:hypothetical protein